MKIERVHPFNCFDQPIIDSQLFRFLIRSPGDELPLVALDFVFKMATAHGGHRAIFVSLDDNGEINNFELFLPTSPQNGKSDLCNVLALIQDKKPSLSSKIRDIDSVKFEKESQYFKSRFIEFSNNDVLEHGILLIGKLIQRGLVTPIDSTKEHENTLAGKKIYCHT